MAWRPHERHAPQSRGRAPFLTGAPKAQHHYDEGIKRMDAAIWRGIGDDHPNGNGAIIVGDYRYLLWRSWDRARPRLLWVFLNPGTADGRADDPTLRRCIGFSQAWHYGGLEIANLFAFRTPRPADL